MEEQTSKLSEEVKAMQVAYNQQIKDLATIEIGAITNITNVFGNSEKITQQVLEECNINTEELLKEGMKINDSNPTISKQDLAIKILSNVASNSKYKKMSKIANEMLKERWWDKNE